MKQTRANTCVCRAKQVGPAGHLQPASRGQPSVCDHVETATAYASANRKAQREGNHNNKHVAPPCDATQDLLVVREGVLSKCCGLGQGPATQMGRRSLTPLPCPQSRQSKRRPYVYTSNRKQRPASSATKALFSLVVAKRERAKAGVIWKKRYFLVQPSEDWARGTPCSCE
jgi:hypothetical protein